MVDRAPKSKHSALYVRVSTNNRDSPNQDVFEQKPEVQEGPRLGRWQSSAAGS